MPSVVMAGTEQSPASFGSPPGFMVSANTGLLLGSLIRYTNSCDEVPLFSKGGTSCLHDLQLNLHKPSVSSVCSGDRSSSRWLTLKWPPERFSLVAFLAVVQVFSGLLQRCFQVEAGYLFNLLLDVWNITLICQHSKEEKQNLFWVNLNQNPGCSSDYKNELAESPATKTELHHLRLQTHKTLPSIFLV